MRKWALGNRAKARVGYEDALEAAERGDYKAIQSDALGNLGSIAYAEGRHVEAENWHLGSLEISNTLTDRKSEQFDWNNLAQGVAAQGKTEDAVNGTCCSTKSVRELPALSFRVSRRREAAIRARKLPDYNRCLQSAPPNHANTGPDVSRADFAFCMMAFDWGFSIEETVSGLMDLSPKAKENGKPYAIRTAQNAAAVERNAKSGDGHSLNHLLRGRP